MGGLWLVQNHKAEFLGKLAIPLLRIKNDEKKWFALKESLRNNYPVETGFYVSGSFFKSVPLSLLKKLNEYPYKRLQLSDPAPVYRHILILYCLQCIVNN